MKDSYIVYKSWFPLIRCLDDKKRLELYDILFSDDINPDASTDPYVKGILTFISNQIKDNTLKYEQRCEKAKESVNKRWKKEYERIPTYTKEYERIPNDNDNDNDNDNVNDNDNDISIINNTNKKDVYLKKYKEHQLLFDSDFSELWSEFVSIKKKKKASVKPKILFNQLEKIVEYSNNNINLAVEILRKSVVSGWSDIYAINNNTYVTKSNATTNATEKRRSLDSMEDLAKRIIYGSSDKNI